MSPSQITNELDSTALIVSRSVVSNSYATPWTPPGSFVHGILQVRILEWVVIPFCRGSSQPSDRSLGCRKTVFPALQEDFSPTEPPEKFSIALVSANKWRSVFFKK